MTKRNITIGIFIGLILAVLYWTYNKVDTVNKGVEKFEAGQAAIDQKVVDLYMEYCGKPTFCSDEDIVLWESSKLLERGSEAMQQEIGKVEEETENRSYQQIFTFSGNGAKNSEPFMIRGSRFKIKYDCTGDYCGAFLEKISGGFGGDVIMNSPGSISDETIFYKKGEYYISANVLGDFTFIVEDYR